MNVDKGNPIVDKSRSFAIRIIKLFKYLTDTKKEFILSKQLLKSGTSIGANIHEGVRGQSKADFGSKMSIALKEAHETSYWLDLLHEGEYINHNEFESINQDCEELCKMLMSIVKTTLNRSKRPKQ